MIRLFFLKTISMIIRISLKIDINFLILSNIDFPEMSFTFGLFKLLSKQGSTVPLANLF